MKNAILSLELTMEPTFLNLVLWIQSSPRRMRKQKVHKMDTAFYVADTPRPAILGLPSCSRLRIVHLDFSVQFRKHGQPIKLSKERGKGKQDMKNLKQIIKAYLDQFEGIRKFPGPTTYIWCEYTQEMPYSYKTHSRQEARHAIRAGGDYPSHGTNGLGIITSLFMESRW